MHPHNRIPTLIAVGTGFIIILALIWIRHARLHDEIGGVVVTHTLYEDFKTDLTEAEGRKDYVYMDSEGFKTAGIGHKLAEDEMMALSTRVSEQQVDAWFREDIQHVFKSIAKHFPNFKEFPHLAQLAIVNWIFQLGAGAPEKFPRATRAIQEGDWERAANEWLYSDPKTKRWSQWRRQTQDRCEQESERLLHVAKE